MNKQDGNISIPIGASQSVYVPPLLSIRGSGMYSTNGSKGVRVYMILNPDYSQSTVSIACTGAILWGSLTSTGGTYSADSYNNTRSIDYSSANGTSETSLDFGFGGNPSMWNSKGFFANVTLNFGNGYIYTVCGSYDS